MSRNAMVVHPHHRDNSLTAYLARVAEKRLLSEGYEVDFLDLAAEGFDPAMTEADQPDWGNRDKRYSDTVMAHQERLLAVDKVVVVFPVYWFSMPALLKGWIDRVWNYGFSYGRSVPRLGNLSVLFVALAGAQEDVGTDVDFIRSSLDLGVRRGIGEFNGLKETVLHLVANSEGADVEDREGHYARIEEGVTEAVADFAR
ncbi:NAD(P)H-dependent oxidoreductase [Salininema proteolyticum]|uniref:NAD(P)H-dependent oxidoreductase n=1 Tax=Salininema proteolyticum TaxID=1607685 RepID=A0ABV8U3D3_9ACTN